MIHPLDAWKVLEKMSLAAERRLLKQTAFVIVKDEVELQWQERERDIRQNALQTTARQMKAKGFELPLITELTGLSHAEIEAL